MAFVWQGKSFYKKLFEDMCSLNDSKQKHIQILEQYKSFVSFLGALGSNNQILSVVPFSSNEFPDTYIVFIAQESTRNQVYTICGHVMNRLRQDDWVYRAFVDINPSTHKAELIDNISKYQRQGIGTLGMKIIRRFLEDRYCVMLYGQMMSYPKEEQASLIAFYQKNGFEISGDSIKLHLEPPDPRFLYI